MQAIQQNPSTTSEQIPNVSIIKEVNIDDGQSKMYLRLINIHNFISYLYYI